MPFRPCHSYAFFPTCLALALTALPSLSQIVPVGKGSYTTTLPAGRKTPADSLNVPVDPQVTADFKQPVTTNEWWSSFLYKRVPNQHGNSGKSYPHPLTIRGAPTGLEMGYASIATRGMDWEWEFAGGTYEYPHIPDLTVGIEGLNVPISKTAGYSDWAVTADWTDGAKNLRATLAHGNPYAFFKITGGAAKIAFASAPTVWSEEGGILGVTVAGHNYGIFPPAGSAWTGTGNARSSTLNGKDYLSVGLLPDNLSTDEARKEALALFRAHAYAFVTKTRAAWAYDEKTALVTTTLTTETEAKEGTETRTMQALYRHQWLNYPFTTSRYTYASPRGTMKLMEGNVITTLIHFTGILPAFPDKGYDRATLQNHLNAENGYTIGDGDTYGVGKSMGRVAMLAPLADQVGNTALRTAFVDKLKAKLESWFTAQAGKTDKIFYYDKKWNILFGYPASFHSDDEVNDHHFHYGYFIMAAAAIAQFDPVWAQAQNWGGMVEMLIKDVANTDDADTRFPRLRNFDPYAGHSWAHGSEYYGRGNNQESSSEAMNFHTGLYLWGLHTNNKAMRDLAIYLYTTESAAVQQYWFDADKAVFPALYPNPCVGQVLGAGGAYWTFFGASANFIHGINFLPLTTGSTYLGWYPENIKKNIDYMYNNPYKYQGKTGTWDDVMWGTLAFADPAAALNRFGGFNAYAAFDGESKAHIYHMVMNLSALGTVQRRVQADVPSYAVFDKGAVRTYVAYNPDDAARTVKFSDGGTLTVQPHTTATLAGSAGPIGINGRIAPARSRPDLVMASGYEGIRLAVRGREAFAIFSPEGKRLWETASGTLPGPQAFARGIYWVQTQAGAGTLPAPQ
ncbi:MAG: putative glycoside hydrolase [Fibrobacteres bacterium]|nr:putative glycoside hydrolase [Fibrobacterota bacterium]